MRRLLLTTALLAACSVERGTGRFDDQHVTDAGADGGGPVAGDAAPPEDLSSPAGTWMLFLENSTCLRALGQNKEQIIWTWYTVDIEDLGPGGGDGERRLKQNLRFCTQEVSAAIANLKTYVPDRIAEFLPPAKLEAILAGPTPGDRFFSTELFETFGLRTIGLDEPLPTTASDERVFDQDEDGHPGVTLVLGTDLCEIYIVQRTRTRLSGEVVDGIRVEGTFSADLDKVVLEATQSLCATANEVTPSLLANRFVLVRIDGRNGAYDFDLNDDGDIGCDEIRDARLFFAEAGTATPRDPDPAACEQ